MGLEGLGSAASKGIPLSMQMPDVGLILVIQSETFQALPNLPTHGYTGPIKVSYGGAATNVGNDFLEVAAAYDKQRGFIDDPNGLYSCDAYGVCDQPSQYERIVNPFITAMAKVIISYSR